MVLSIDSTQRVAFLGNYVPRKCGIATFTTDLYEAISTNFPNVNAYVLPMNDRAQGYDYPSAVRFEIDEQDLDNYRRAAEFLNLSNSDVLCVQHEFGIYGGPAGAHLLTLLRAIKIPIVTTLHTVLANPSEDQRYVFDRLTQLSDRLVVMTPRAKQILRDIYHIPNDKIDLIPHGIPDMPFIDPNFYKDQFGVAGKTLLLTFGLLSPGKGIENVIEAMPAIIKKHPNVVYLVLGVTHPNVVAQEGESYRSRLEQLAHRRGVEKNVLFHNKFVPLEKLKEYIGATDIYITPYLNAEQITSGTLAYTFGAGKPIISTPYQHAKELLADDCGILVPFADPAAIANAVDNLLTNEAYRHAMRKKAYQLGREMIWPKVAWAYMESFTRACTFRTKQAVRPKLSTDVSEPQTYQLPLIRIDYLQNLSDSTGIIQHAIFNIPNFQEGYCTDDNARAYILTVLLQNDPHIKQLKLGPEINRLSNIYLAFLLHAFDPDSNRFHNFMSYDRRWLDVKGSEDSQARALWALSFALGKSNNVGHRGAAARIFGQALPAALTFTSPRAWAFTILAVHEYLRRFEGDRNASLIRQTLIKRFEIEYEKVAQPKWPWFEERMTYDNARIPHALLLSGYWTNQPKIFELGLKSLRWLLEIQTSKNDCFSPIGSNGFYTRGKTRAYFDQQPLEAHAMVSACLEAYRLTRDRSWIKKAQHVFEWFLGRNDLGLPVYDTTTGGCRDGLHPDRVNENQGAESSLAFHLSLTEMREIAKEVSAPTIKDHYPLMDDLPVSKMLVESK